MSGGGGGRAGCRYEQRIEDMVEIKKRVDGRSRYEQRIEVLYNLKKSGKNDGRGDVNQQPSQDKRALKI